MTLTAHITNHADTPWLTITNHATTNGAIITFDAPLNLTTKKTTKAEIDHAHHHTGIPRADLYDAIRTYNHQRGKRGQTNAA
jgi:hypothetical protein